MKVGLVYSFEESAWFSVTKIVRNLIESYKLVYKDSEMDLINFSVASSAMENEARAREVASKNYDKIIFLDHKPHPLAFLEGMGAKGLDSVGEIVFHVFGDFTLTMDKWRRTEFLLKDRKVKFICASDKEAKLVQKFCKQNEILSVNPFPVDGKAFRSEFSQREETREKYGLAADDFIFLYTGRLSQQKNTKELATLFLELKKRGKLGSKHKLLLAGSYDQIGLPYLQQPHALGEYFRKTEKSLNQFDENLKKDLIFLGPVPHEDLPHLYNAADSFISLSTYHDEDYGMAVAEAVCCGLPAVLTDWAGYSSFKSPEAPEAVKFIPVSLGIRSPVFDEKTAKDLIASSASRVVKEEDRLAASKAFREKLTIEAVAMNLKKILSAQTVAFAGYSELMKILGTVSVFKVYPFMSETSKCYNEFYFKVYDVYAEEN